MDNLEQLVNVVKRQAEIFLLDAYEFHPFGNYLDLKNNIVPALIHLDNDFPTVTEVIDHLMAFFDKVDYTAAIIAVNVTINKPTGSCDALQMRIVHAEKDDQIKYFKYLITGERVIFEQANL